MAGKMKSKIVDYLRTLDPAILGFEKHPEIQEVSRLGLGESHLNYIAKMNNQIFLVRINMDPSRLQKSRREFEVLKFLEPLKVAPKAYHCESRPEKVGAPFIIIEFLAGEDLAEERANTPRILQLANLIAGLHNTDVSIEMKNRLRKFEASPEALWAPIANRFNYLRKKWITHEIDSELTNGLLEIVERFKQVRIEFSRVLLLGHGDIAPQNVLVCKEQLRLIDWEDAGLMDPAQDLAILFDSFDLSLSQQERFLKTYLKQRADATLRQRVKKMWPWQVLGTFLWSLMHVFEIGDHEFHKEFVRHQELGDHINYAEKMFGKCKNAGIFSEDQSWAAEKVFPRSFITGYHNSIKFS